MNNIWRKQYRQLILLIALLWTLFIVWIEKIIWLPDLLNSSEKLSAIVLGWTATIIFWYTRETFDLKCIANKEIKELRNQPIVHTKLEIYKQITSDIHLNIRDTGNNFSIFISFQPLNMMKGDLELGFILGDTLEEHKAKQKSVQRWLDYMSELSDKKSKFNNTFLNLMRIMELWEGVFSPLSKSRNTLLKTSQEVSERFNKYYKDLQKLDVQEWEKWDSKEMFKESLKQKEYIIDFQCLIEDMFVLCHNILIADIFGVKREHRKPLDDKFKVLTEEGLKSSARK